MNEDKFKELTNNIPYWINKAFKDGKDSTRLGYAFMHEGVAYGLDIHISINKITGEKS